jgi:hypothetical protein
MMSTEAAQNALKQQPGIGTRLQKAKETVREVTRESPKYTGTSLLQ